jgi:hypothetical protein
MVDTGALFVIGFIVGLVTMVLGAALVIAASRCRIPRDEERLHQLEEESKERFRVFQDW